MQVQLATRLDVGLRKRLRIYAALTGRTVTDVVSAALDGYLPTAEDMIRDVDSGSRENALLAEQSGMA